MKARELMSTNLVVVPPETPVSAVASLLATRGISAAPVVDNSGAPVGLVTEGDLIRRLADEKPGRLDWFFGLFGDRSRLAERFSKAHGAVGARCDDLRTRDRRRGRDGRGHLAADGAARHPARAGGA